SISFRKKLFGLVLIGAPIVWLAKARADESALQSAGFNTSRDTLPDRFFNARAAEGLSPAEVARRMPPGATVTGSSRHSAAVRIRLSSSAMSTARRSLGGGRRRVHQAVHRLANED